MSKLRKAKLKARQREEEIRRHFRSVRFCPKCGAVLTYQQDSQGSRWACPNHGQVNPERSTKVVL